MWGKDAIYSGINLIESIKFLLKVKYSFIFSEYDWLRDEKAAAEEALQAAQLSLTANKHWSRQDNHRV